MVQTAADIEREVLEAEAGRVKALLDEDFTALERILADDLSFVHSSGRFETKEMYINSLRGGTRYLTMETEEMAVRAMGELAVINSAFRSKVDSRGREVNLHSRALLVWAKRDGRWQLAAYQSTPIANP